MHVLFFSIDLYGDLVAVMQASHHFHVDLSKEEDLCVCGVISTTA